MSTPTSKSFSVRSYDHDYFERLYRARPDPWSVLTSDYELAKFARSMQSLEKPTYAHGLELGCSIGGLTRFLTARCRMLTAVDTSHHALRRARRLCTDANVRFVQAHLPDGAFEGPFDLLVLSEVLYYFNEAELKQLAGRLSQVMTPDVEILVVHWTGRTDYPLSGDRAMDVFRHHMHAQVRRHMRHPAYRLETWTCASRPACVAMGSTQRAP